MVVVVVVTGVVAVGVVPVSVGVVPWVGVGSAGGARRSCGTVSAAWLALSQERFTSARPRCS